ncbi:MULTISPECIES: hypothetical protein [unclassified Curtobacterium]|uniref:hypothetical protein n=1 Tax=unclassified Curtobacterium TaxID=257496 RepID=UPI00104BE21A|nr:MULTISPECIES: hypothetical protein [unclassified Curtobacterium]
MAALDSASSLSLPGDGAPAIDDPALETAQQPAAPGGTRIHRQQWHRRGLRAPDEIAAIVYARLHDLPDPVEPEDDIVDPSYGDFFTGPSA